MSFVAWFWFILRPDSAALSAPAHIIMIWLRNMCIFLSLTARRANADPDLTAGSAVLTLSEQTDLSCCRLGQNTSQCDFYANSRAIGQQNSSEDCCKLTVTGTDLSQRSASMLLWTETIFYCKSQPDINISRNVSITVWRLSFSGKHIFVFVVILGTLILISLITFNIICVIYSTKTQGFRQKLCSASYTAQEIDTENQDANSDPAEVQDEKTQTAEDELLYATVNYSAAGENSVSVMRFESGTDYATVVIR